MAGFSSTHVWRSLQQSASSSTPQISTRSHTCSWTTPARRDKFTCCVQQRSWAVCETRQQQSKRGSHGVAPLFGPVGTTQGGFKRGEQPRHWSGRWHRAKEPRLTSASKVDVAPTSEEEHMITSIPMADFRLGGDDEDKQCKEFRQFEEAREYTRTLGLTSQKDWQELSRSGMRPDDIPSNPQRTYRNKGWVSWPDWLGYGKGKQARPRTPSKQFLPFDQAREYARSQGLPSTRKWREWCASGKRPHNIPSDPQSTFRDDGWVSWPDWLGYTEDRSSGNAFLSFENAREHVRLMGLKSHKEWQEWSSSGKRPEYIPSNPQTAYHDEGWLSWPDWLGYGEGRLPRKVPLAREELAPEDETEYRELQLASTKEWHESREWSALYNFIVPLYYTSGTLIYLFYYRTTVISLFYYIIK
uniref:Uncharacterized protein n=1 Tax=Pyramimonas obovata TaxID=1411642 RepID=A0A7S0RM63_9CHLO|mmetsp:Transcript_374/g.861  ORF Transcript_374/g.861 Transcript_374/m.861 type:complete len:414 (+) Transcript_374:50-1291(+)